MTACRHPAGCRSLHAYCRARGSCPYTPVYRVRAWRKPNEDGASFEVQCTRTATAFVAPLDRALRAAIAARIGDRHLPLSQIAADLRAQKASSTDPDRLERMAREYER